MEYYDIIKQLGSGSYGEAFLAVKKIDTTKCVLKEIKVGHLNKDDLKDTNQEVKVLASLVHNHITRFHDSFYKDTSLFIVMEYCAGGDLKSLIYNRKGIHFPEERVLDWFCQLCLAVKYIHDRHIIHRDIKPQNVLLTEDGKVKLGDFGIAKILDKTSDLANTCIGTPYYLSPEMCENKPYSMKSDIWSLGCVLYELVALQHAFNAKNMKTLVSKIVKCSYQTVPNQYSREMKLLVSSIFQRDVKSRPSINVILRKQFILKRISRFVCEEDCEELKANILSTKGKKIGINMNKRSTIGKRIGISSPLAKYGNSARVRSPKLIYGSSKGSTINSIRSPRSSNTKCVKQLRSRTKHFAHQDEVFPIHYGENKAVSTFLKAGRKHTQKVTVNSDIKQSSFSENKFNFAMLNTPVTDKSYKNRAKAKLTITQSLINNIQDSSLYDAKVPICTQQLESLMRSNKYSTPISQSSGRKAHCPQSIRSTLLKKKICALASSEVRKVSIAANNLRQSRNSYANCNPVSSFSMDGILSPEDINISVPSVCRAISHKDSFEDINRLHDCIDPVVSCNDDSRRTPSFCRPKWNPAATPVFSNYPLELTDTVPGSTNSSEKVLTKRKQWSRSQDEILQMLSKANLSDAQTNQLDLSGVLNKNFAQIHNIALLKSKSLPSVITEQGCNPTQLKSDERNCNKTIQVHNELWSNTFSIPPKIGNLHKKNDRVIAYKQPKLIDRERSFNNNIRISSNFVDNSPNFHEKSKISKNVTFNYEGSLEKQNSKPKRRLFSFLYKKTVPPSDIQENDRFFKKSRISGLLKRFIKRGDKNSSNCSRSEEKSDLSFSHCLQEGELFSAEDNVTSETSQPVVEQLIDNSKAINNSNDIDSGVDIISKQATFTDVNSMQGTFSDLASNQSTTKCSPYCVTINNIENDFGEATYTIQNEISSISHKEELRKTAFVFVEGVFQSAIKNLRKEHNLNSEQNGMQESALETPVNLIEVDSKQNHDDTKNNDGQKFNSTENVYYADKDGFLREVSADNDHFMKTIDNQKLCELNTFKFVDRIKSANVSLSYEDLTMDDIYCQELTDFNCDNNVELSEGHTYVVHANTLTSAISPPNADDISLTDTFLVDSTQKSQQDTDSKHFWKSLENLLNEHENNNQSLPPQVNVTELGFTPSMQDIFGWIEEKKTVLEQELGLEPFLDNYKILERAFEAETEIMGGAVVEVKIKLGSSREHFVNEILELLIAESVYQN